MSGTTGFFFIVGLAVGHAALAVLFLSWVHALGLSPKLMTRIAAAPLLLPAAVALAMGWLIVSRRVDDWPKDAIGYACLCNIVAWVLLPASTVARRLRRLPPGVTVRASPLTHEDLRGETSDWIGEGPNAWMLRLPGNESMSLRAADYDVALPGLPRGFGPLRILHISDLHFARCYTRAYFEAVAESAASWDVDLVLFTGDLLDDEATLKWTGPVLERLRGRLGQFAILGNHDVAHRPGRVRRALRSAGFTMLDGRWASVVDDGRTIALGGTSAPWGPTLDPAGRPEADLTIVLSHSPDQFPRLAGWETIDLVLAGHNHGGQIRLPILGPVVMPSRYGRRYDRGFFRRGRTLMEVTQGIGGRHPLRYGCPPEFVRLVLRPALAPATPASRVFLTRDSTSRT
jgi:predicted MPP superfamily phosphohydrolase